MTFLRAFNDIDRLKSFGHSEAYGFRMNSADYGSMCIKDGKLTIEGITGVPAFSVSARQCTLELGLDGIILLKIHHVLADVITWRILQATMVDETLMHFLKACNSECERFRSHEFLDHTGDIEPLPFQKQLSS